MQRIENNQNQTQRSHQGVNNPYASNNPLSLKTKLANLQSKVNGLRQNGVDSSNDIQYLGNLKDTKKHSDQKNTSFQETMNNAKSIRGEPRYASDMNQVFKNLDNGNKSIVKVNSEDKGSGSNFAVVNSIRGNSVELSHPSQDQPIIMSLRQLYNAISSGNKSNNS